MAESPDLPIAVIGAGPAGLTTAWQLARRGRRVVVLEKDATVGGLGKTVTINGFRLDYGPHTFHIRETPESEQIRRELMPLFGEDPRVLARGTRILLGGKYYTYPLKITELLTGVPPWLALRILWDYLRANATCRFQPPTKDSSFEEWGVKNLGRTLYDLCFGIYSERVWGLPTSRISSRQAQRVAKLNLTELLLRTLGLKVDPATYFKHYLYPRGGIGLLYERMAKRLEEQGGEVRLGAEVRRIVREGQRITRVVYRQEGEDRGLECAGVVSTLPLPLVARLFEPGLDAEIQARASRLRYRGVQFCYLVVNRPRVTDYHWCYLLDANYRCNRVSEQKNVSEEMLPDGKTVLLFELTCTKGDAVWNASEQELFELVRQDLRSAKLLPDESAVERFFARRVEYAYPVYEMGFEENLFFVLEALHGLENFLSLGRHGLFLNNSMDDNVLLALKATEFLTTQDLNPHWNGRAWFQQMSAFMHLRFAGK
ncbi:MAG: FAD-dependent oxidoreductase [Candidatus Omnitrophica bacterium]|nr:FAD-dependent oxidoreductase [Candidatus Omnitrophota bacterium]